MAPCTARSQTMKYTLKMATPLSRSHRCSDDPPLYNPYTLTATTPQLPHE